MQTEVGKANGKKRGRPAKGRTEPDGQTAVPDIEALRKRLPNLGELYEKATAASTEFDEAVTAAAKDTGFNASAVKKRVKAEAKDELEKVRKVVDQLVLLFEDE